MKLIEKPIRLHNRTCVYCGVDVTAGTPREREHVIGRNFVPKGSFRAGDWNLIVWACHPCNHFKSTLEGEISAITLQPELGTVHPDPTLTDLAERKGSKAICEATGRVVRASYEEHRYPSALGLNSTMTFGFVGPPRLLPGRLKALAEMHIQAFFYSITYNESLQRGGFLPNGIVWVNLGSKGGLGESPSLRFCCPH